MADDELWQIINEKLQEEGIDLKNLCCSDGDAAKVKLVCVAPTLADSMREVSGSPRDQVVMVRVSAEMAETLDAWIAAGAAKSRSEAAALFIKEGLKVRADELERLRDALDEVREAQDRLSHEARAIFNEPEEP